MSIVIRKGGNNNDVSASVSETLDLQRAHGCRPKRRGPKNRFHVIENCDYRYLLSPETRSALEAQK